MSPKSVFRQFFAAIPYDLTVETATDAYIIEVKRDSTAKKALVR